MRRSVLAIVSGAALLTAAPQLASAAPLAVHGAALKSASETGASVENIHYYRRYYGGYGYGGYGYRGYGYGYRGHGYGY